jgi:molybdate transport system regulatory protein
MTATASARLSIRIELPNGSRLGPGKVALLESIGQRRSIAAAARDHDMSYRRAWLLIDDLNRAFSEPVVETFPGRSQGAGAALTAFGTRLVALFRATERRCARAAGPSLHEIAEGSNPGYAAGELTRSGRKSGARA